MKIKNLGFLCLLSLLLSGCFTFGGGSDDDIVQPYVPYYGNYEPVILDRSEFETTTLLETIPRTIINSGKIYVKGNFIFVNEVNHGFHVINNVDPENPENIAFIQALGSSDLSIKNDVLYINNATDLIAVTLEESAQTLTITKRIANVFPQIYSPEGFDFYSQNDNEIVVDWQLLE